MDFGVATLIGNGFYGQSEYRRRSGNAAPEDELYCCIMRVFLQCLEWQGRGTSSG